MVKRISFLVHGEVQGVGFRYFARKRAATLSLTGWIRNTSNGKVEGEAQGSLDNLQKFVTELNKGPSYSSVSQVDINDIDAVDGEEGFHVRR